MRIKVGPYSHSLEKNDARLEDLSDGDVSTFGYHEGRDTRITILSTLAPDMRAETLLHEVIHACFWATRVALTDEAEEVATKTLAPILLDTLRRNPRLRKELFE